MPDRQSKLRMAGKIVFKRIRKPAATFHAPIVVSTMLGTLLCLSYYTFLHVSPIRFSLLIRYSECHEVAYATVELFFIAICALGYKLSEAFRQQQLLRNVRQATDDIKAARMDAECASEVDQLLWLEAAWKSQSLTIYNSWMGQRVRAVLASLMLRKSLDLLDEDQKRFADRDADSQHDSYALVRINAWAMPMLGFLGTVLGLSTTLGQMDASALASGSQKAMNEITSGLYVAFDTTAIGLILTMVVIFLQFAVGKTELSILSQVDQLSADLLGTCLSPNKAEQDLTNVEASLKAVTSGVLKSVEKLVKKQTEAWADSLERAEKRWLETTQSTQQLVSNTLLPSIEQALESLSRPMMEHSERISRIHSEGATLVDSRIHQWQLTISEQSRALVEQQREIHKQSQLLMDLIEKAELVKSIETPLQATLHRMTDIDRFHDAAVCLTEAVAVLGTQMERYGYLGRQPVRRRPDTPSADELTPATIPFPRKAG